MSFGVRNHPSQPQRDNRPSSHGEDILLDTAKLVRSRMRATSQTTKPTRAGTNLEHARRYNTRLVLEAVRLHGPLARADIVQMTALTKQTIHNITAPLVQQGLIREVRGNSSGRRGAPFALLELNAAGAYAVGLYLDREQLTGVLVDLSGAVCNRVSHKVSFPPPEEALPLMVASAQTLIRGVDRNRVRGVGVGIPGFLRVLKTDDAKSVVNPNNFPGWDDVPVVEKLSAPLGLPVLLEKDATAAAIGESYYGAGRSVGTFFYVFLTIGIGGGLIVEGQPVGGFEGNAGEIGFSPTRIAENGDVERLGSYFHLPFLFQKLSSEGIQVTSLVEVATLFETENKTVVAWLDRAARQLAFALAGIEFALDPEAIVIGGSWPALLVTSLLDKLAGYLTPLRVARKGYQSVLLAGQAGEDAAALGVATLPIYATLAPHLTLLLKQP